MDGELGLAQLEILKKVFEQVRSTQALRRAGM
jgi:hypothetical protein